MEDGKEVRCLQCGHYFTTRVEQDPRFAAIEEKMEEMKRRMEEMTQEYKIK